MQVTLYATASDRRKLNKTLVLIADKDNVTLKDSPNSLTDPTIILGTFTNWKQCNMVYIPDFGRYYFVNDIRELSGGRLQLMCHVDVLMSNQQSILNLNAIVDRSSNSGNQYLVDSEQGVLNYRKQEIINFPADKRFNSSLQYILTVAGGSGS